MKLNSLSQTVLCVKDNLEDNLTKMTGKLQQRSDNLASWTQTLLWIEVISLAQDQWGRLCLQNNSREADIEIIKTTLVDTNIDLHNTDI